MVLCSEHGVLHACRFCGLGPLFGIVEVRIETGEIPFAVGIGINRLSAHHPFMAGWNRIEPKMNEHPKPVMPPPCHTLSTLRIRLVENPFRWLDLLRREHCQTEHSKNTSHDMFCLTATVKNSHDFL